MADAGAEHARETLTKVKDIAEKNSAQEAYNALMADYMDASQNLKTGKSYAKEIKDDFANYLGPQKSLEIANIWEQDKKNIDRVESVTRSKTRDRKLDEKEIDVALQSDKVKALDKAMLLQLKAKYQSLSSDTSANKTADGYEDKGSYLEKHLGDNTIIKKGKDGTVFQYVPQGDYAHITNIEDQKKNGTITVNGKERKLQDGDVATMDESGNVTVKNDKNGTVREYKPDGTSVERGKNGSEICRDADDKITSVKIPDKGVDIHWNPETNRYENKDGSDAKVKEIKRGEDGSIEVTRSDDSKIIYKPDGSTAEVSKDAKGNERTVAKDKDGGVIAVKIPALGVDIHWDPAANGGKGGWEPADQNIRHVQQDKDGTIRVIHNDGTCDEYKPDGTVAKGQPYKSIDMTEQQQKDIEKISVRKGEGYYQTAARYFETLGIKATPKQILALARYMRDHIYGKRTVLRQGETLITADNMKKIQERAERIVNGKTNVDPDSP